MEENNKMNKEEFEKKQSEEWKEQREHKEYVEGNKRKLEKKLISILFDIAQAPTSPAHTAQCKNAELLMRYLGIAGNIQISGGNN